MRHLLPLVLLCAACSEPVRVVGVLYDAPGEDAEPAPGATVLLRDELGARLDRTTTGPSGRFRLEAPAGIRIYAETSAEGYVPASFTGASGLLERLVVPDHQLYLVSEEEVAAWRELFAGCPGIEAGSMVFGEVRASDLTDPETGEHPVITRGRLEVVGAQTAQACYLDDEGLAYDPSAVETGDSGRFAVPDVGRGAKTLVLEIALGAGLSTRDFFEVWVPSEGVVPRFPLFVEAPLVQ